MTTRLEWQIKHGFDESEMQFLDRIIGLWHGKIVAVVDNPTKEVLRCPE